MSVINKIKEIIPYRIKTFLKKNFRKYQGLKQLDKKMLKYINYKEGFYIEIGAHDGIKNSNTFFYEKYKNWSGILIEPSDYFELLKKNRSKNNKFFNYACSDLNHEEETVLSGSGDWSVVKDLVEKDYLNFYSKKQNQANIVVKEKIIKLKTLNSILKEAIAPKTIDFFSLDVEGMELKVLQGIDFNIYNFKFILVECANEDKFKIIFNFLKEKNYDHIENLTPWDYLFKFSEKKQ